MRPFICLFVFVCVFVHLVNAQPFQVGHTTVTFTDSSRGNRSVPVEIYYPADLAGNDVPFSSSLTNKAPVIVMGHGFVMTYDAYFNFRDLLVPAGYILALPTTEGGFSPSHSTFGADLAFTIKAITALNTSSTSLFSAKVDTVSCVMGHSMGGGASFLACEADATIDAIVTFAAAETTPSAIAAAYTIAQPALIFAGLNDCVTPPATNQMLMYDTLNVGCRHYIGIKGGSHCQMAETSLTCDFGEASCTPSPAISRATQHSIIDTFLLPWLDFRLKGICAAGQHFDELLQGDTSVTFLKSCNLCSATGIAGTAQEELPQVYPNPANNNITFTKVPSNLTELRIFAITGQQLVACNLIGSCTLPITGLPDGLYIYSLTGDGATAVTGRFMVAR